MSSHTNVAHNNPTILFCSGCHRDLDTEPYAQLLVRGRPASSGCCRHIFCMKCFGTAHCRRGANLRLCCIGSSCGHALKHPSNSADTKSQPAQGCQRNFSIIRSLEQSDHSLLWRFIHPIATGKVLSELSRNSIKSFQWERNASFVASDLVEH